MINWITFITHWIVFCEKKSHNTAFGYLVQPERLLYKIPNLQINNGL